MPRLLQILLLIVALAVVVPGTAQAHPRVGGWLQPALQAWQAGDRKALQQVADNGRALIQGELQTGRWRLQLHLSAGVDADLVDDRAVRALGGEVAVRGIDVIDVWLPLRAVETLLARMPQVVFAQLPWRPNTLTGPKTSEGATQMRSGTSFACLAADASGVTVAVLDSGFDGLEKSHDSGEVPNLKGQMLSGGGSHGTMCCEVVADVAPKAQILPYAANSFAELQLFIKQISSKGNPNEIAVISHSVIWMGMSFGRHDGKLCAMTDLVRDAGVAWVSASGNSGGGQFYKAIWSDVDKDDLHEFTPDSEMLQFNQWGGGHIQVTLDWDDYSQRTVNLDLYLYRKEGQAWVKVRESKLKSGIFVPPMEQVVEQQAKGGVYGLEIRAVGKVPKGMKLRILSMGGGTGALSVWHKNGNVYDPASCAGVLTVGAIYQGHYSTGPLEGYSSYGPTTDNRIKPEVMAPTGVTTSVGVFFGTSAACPHAAGALATWIEATGQAPLVAAENLRKAAIPMGETLPDEAYGWGRVALPAVDLGWQCTAAELPAGATCVTACKSVGTHTCGANCRFNTCVPPGEVCNQFDDNCDGATDEGLPNCAQAAAVVAEAKVDAAAAVEVVADAVVDPGGGLPVDSQAADALAVPVLAKPKDSGGCRAARATAPGADLWAIGALAVAAAWVTRRQRHRAH